MLMDDDISGIGKWERQVERVLNEDEFYQFCEIGFIMAEDLGVKYWGMNLLMDKGAYRIYSILFEECNIRTVSSLQ